jgi:hypothetical protein
MLVDIGMVPLQFYLYGSEDNDEVGEHRYSTVTQSDTRTKRNVTQTLTETKITMTQSVAGITIVFATSGNVTQPIV